MKSTLELFRQLKPVKVLVTGDFFLDTYTIGKAKRISPEAPVAVVNVEEQKALPGGAGNVVLNLKSLDIEPIAFGRIGNDPYGQEILRTFEQEEISTDSLLIDSTIHTPNKMRVISDRQQVVRIDYEKIVPLSREMEERALSILPELIAQVDCVAVSDYAKGFLTDSILQKLISLSKEKGIAVIVDPKGNQFQKYQGCTLIKPNLKETLSASKLPENDPLDAHAMKVLEDVQADYLVVTLSDSGIALFDKEGNRSDYATKKREVIDVTGAGDTVLATLVMAIANHFSLDDALPLANLAAGIAVERLGCARVSISELTHALFTENRSNKVFDQEHLTLLQQALEGIPYKMVYYDQPFSLNVEQLLLLNQLSEQETLVLVLSDEALDPPFVEMLSLLEPVDFIIQQTYAASSIANP